MQQSSRVLPPHSVTVREGERDNFTSLMAACGATKRYNAKPGEIIDLHALGEGTRVEIRGNDLVVHARGQDSRIAVEGQNNRVFRCGMDGEYLHITVNGKPDRPAPRPDPPFNFSFAQKTAFSAAPARNGSVYRRVCEMLRKSSLLRPPAPSHSGRSMGRFC